MRFAGLLYRAWWMRRAAFLPFHDAAARLYEETRAADLVSDTEVPLSPAACLDYHRRQLIHYAKYRKAALYGRKAPRAAIEPIAESDLWTGTCTDDMSKWITKHGVEYTDLSIRHHDLKRATRLVKQSVQSHDALLAWCHSHSAGASRQSSDGGGGRPILDGSGRERGAIVQA